MRLLAVVAFLVLLNPRAFAADIEVIDMGEVNLITITGEIVHGDSQRFLELVQSSNGAAVELAGPGGLVSEALTIGREIRRRKIATMLPGTECYSACGLIWIAGDRRYITPTAKLGLHAAFRKVDGQYEESGVANAEIGSYLTQLGLRIEAIRFFTSARPDGFLLLTPERARALGIDVYERKGGKTISPAQAPTVDTFAKRFVSYVLLRSRCTSLLNMDPNIVGRANEDAMLAGQELAGEETWTDVWMSMVDTTKRMVDSKGPLAACLETEARLRKEGLPTGIDGPSFPCSTVLTAAERAVCADGDLWSKDRAMTSLYVRARGLGPNDLKLREALLAGQRGWVKQRDACGDDVGCIHRAYDNRFQTMKDIMKEIVAETE